MFIYLYQSISELFFARRRCRLRCLKLRSQLGSLLKGVQGSSSYP